MSPHRPLQLDHVDVHVARQILRSLHARSDELATFVDQELTRHYGPDDVESVAAHVFDELEFLDVRELWDRSGDRGDGGYVEPVEAAYTMVREAVEPYLARLEDHLREGRREEADACVRGIGLGLYEFDRESTGEFRDWAEDDAQIVFEEALDRWREARKDQETRQNMRAWMSEYLPDWRISP